MANIPLDGYPVYMGNKIRQIFDHSGPSSYSNIGTNSGTGDRIRAAEFGIGGFEEFMSMNRGNLGGYSFSGNFLVKIFESSSGTTPSGVLPLGDAFQAVTLQWFTTSAAFGAIGAEVANGVDLSGEFIRLNYWGV